MEETGFDSFLVTGLPNIFYLSGFRGSEGAFVLTSSEAILFVDGRYGTQAKEESPCEVVIWTSKSRSVSETLKKCGAKRVAIEAHKMTVQFREALLKEWFQAELCAGGDWLNALRSRKEEDEMTILRKANRIADDGCKQVLASLAAGQSEKEIADELEYRMKRNGAEKTSFDMIVASGERGALPHAKPTERRLKEGDLVTIDFGCTLSGYQTDQTITLGIGSPPSKLKDIYHIVKEAHDLAAKSIRPGIAARELDRIARDHISSQGYGDYYTHALGHGVGIEVHEYPFLSSRSEAIMEEGMIVTVEPGVYLPGVGGVRIEDALEVTKEGAKYLTGLDKSFHCR